MEKAKEQIAEKFWNSTEDDFYDWLQDQVSDESYCLLQSLIFSLEPEELEGKMQEWRTV